MCRQIECGLGSSPGSFFVTTTGLKMLWLLCKYLSFVRKIRTASFQDVFGFTSWAHTYLFSEVFGISIHSINLPRPYKQGYVEPGSSFFASFVLEEYEAVTWCVFIAPQGALYDIVHYYRPTGQFFRFSLSPRHIATALAPKHYNMINARPLHLYIYRLPCSKTKQSRARTEQEKNKIKTLTSLAERIFVCRK